VIKGLSTFLLSSGQGKGKGNEEKDEASRGKADLIAELQNGAKIGPLQKKCQK